MYSPSLSGFFTASFHLGILQAFPRLSLNVSQLGSSQWRCTQLELCPHLAVSGPRSCWEMKWKSPLDSPELPQHDHVHTNEEFGLFITCPTYLTFSLV